jgi:U3 small nucleolar RNA-associated protein 21
LVRSFEKAAMNKITDLGFSHDGKWVLCSSLDSCVRVWDLLTGSLIDWVQFKHAPLSLDISPSGEFLATSHQGQKGVYLWSNKNFF